MNLIFNFIILVLILISSPSFADDRLPVFVSIVPQKYFVTQIGGNLVDTRVMVLPGASPATYEPKPSQMAALSKARIYFSIGVPFEHAWLNKIEAANPKMSVIRTDIHIKKIAMDSRHSHGDDDSPLETALDPHVWLSPKLVKIQLGTILNALIKADPVNEKIYKKNYFLFLKQIELLDTEIENIFLKKENMRFMVFHPSWGYFAQAYGLKQVPIEIEGKTIKPAQLRDIIHHALGYKINVIFVQPQFSAKSAKLIAREIKGQIVFADPLAEDWIKNMKHVALKFKEALR